MQQYLDLLKDVINNGIEKEDRTDTGTLSVFGRQLRFDLSKGFPIATTKKVFFKGIVHELLWFLSGDTNIKYLQDNNVHIWDEWADENGDLGPIYGSQWRKWNKFDLIDYNYKKSTIDQIQKVIDSIKSYPHSRRHLVLAWNPAEIDNMKLPPCHYAFQFYVANNKLFCMFNMRSNDLFLGAVFNIASYALLTHMIAQVCDLQVGDLVASLGDVHLYLNHLEQAKEQLKRKPYPLPVLKLNPNIKNIDDFKYEDIKLENYIYHPTIKAKIAI